MDAKKKLFLNVNPNVIHDAAFKEEFTESRSEKCGLDFQNIAFEITENIAIMNKKAFLNSIEHYKNQNYEIAIDYTGSGHFGFNAINDIKPNIIKLDIFAEGAEQSDDITMLSLRYKGGPNGNNN